MDISDEAKLADQERAYERFEDSRDSEFTGSVKSVRISIEGGK